MGRILPLAIHIMAHAAILNRDDGLDSMS